MQLTEDSIIMDKKPKPQGIVKKEERKKSASRATNNFKKSLLDLKTESTKNSMISKSTNNLKGKRN